MHRVLLGLVLLSGLAFAEAARFKTVDGLEIVADYHEHVKGAPTVVCVPMYRSVRGSYAPLLAPLKKRELNMLAIDTRGHAYLGVPTLQHPEHWPGTRVLTLYSEEEKRVSEKVAAALGKAADLRVPHWSKDDPATRQPGFFSSVIRPSRKVGDTTFTFMVWAVGDDWHFGALVDRPFRGVVRFAMDEETVEFPFDPSNKGEVAGSDGVVGEQAVFRDKTWITFQKTGAARRSIRLGITFQPNNSEVIRLPMGGGHFCAIAERRP